MLECCVTVKGDTDRQSGDLERLDRAVGVAAEEISTIATEAEPSFADADNIVVGASLASVTLIVTWTSSKRPGASETSNCQHVLLLRFVVELLSARQAGFRLSHLSRRDRHHYRKRLCGSGCQSCWNCRSAVTGIRIRSVHRRRHSSGLSIFSLADDNIIAGRRLLVDILDRDSDLLGRRNAVAIGHRDIDNIDVVAISDLSALRNQAD